MKYRATATYTLYVEADDEDEAFANAQSELDSTDKSVIIDNMEINTECIEVEPEELEPEEVEQKESETVVEEKPSE